MDTKEAAQENPKQPELKTPTDESSRQYDAEQTRLELLVVDITSYHKPTPEQVEQISAVRAGAQAFLLAVLRNCPAGPDRSAAVRKIREGMMTANASIVVPAAQGRI